MGRDPIVEEVRKTREEIFARFGNDLGRYIAFLRAKRAKTGGAEGGSKTTAKKRSQTQKRKNGVRKPDRKGRRAA